jgi:hypothetical protein
LEDLLDLCRRGRENGLGLVRVRVSATREQYDDDGHEHERGDAPEQQRPAVADVERLPARRLSDYRRQARLNTWHFDRARRVRVGPRCVKASRNRWRFELD